MAYRCRLYPTNEQEPTLERHCADARFVWNLGLEQRNFWSRNRGQRLPRLGAVEQQKTLAEARQHTWLGDGASSIQQQALRDLDRAFRNWWGNPAHFGRPTWRKKGTHESFAIRDLKVERLNRKWATVSVPKLGPVKFRLSGRSFAAITGCSSARVSLNRAGRWHVSFTGPQPVVTRISSGTSVGLDMGVAATVTTSNGQHLQMGDLLSPGERTRKLRLQRHLARQTPGSKRRTRTKQQLAKVSARETDRRKNWIEQTTTRLVRGYDLIAIEDLKVKNMVASARGTTDAPGTNVAQKRGLNRSIHARAWGLFRTRLENKAQATTDPNGTPHPVNVVAVNPAYTSQRCHRCNHTSPKNRESQADFRCQSCGWTGNADVNAAINILAAGRAVAGRRAIPSKTSPPSETGNETSTNQKQDAA